jgi:Fic family protein
MENVSAQIKLLRISKNLNIQEACRLTKIDQALFSKYEAGKRMPSEKHLKDIAIGLEGDYNKLRKSFLVEKIVDLLFDEDDTSEIFQVAEERIEYQANLSKRTFFPVLPNSISEKLLYADELKAQWLAKKPLNGTQLLKMKEYFNIKYTFDSNRIEGNTLTLQETQLVINEGITIGGKSMREHLEAINHAEAIGFIDEMVNGREDLTKRNLLDIHRLILKSIDAENAGKYRSVPVRISGSEHLPPEPYLIEKRMEDYFINYSVSKKKLHPIILAANVHEHLVNIHPFIDGNGRTSRLLMNFILIKNGFCLTILKGDLNSRLKYYKALEIAQINKNYDVFYELIVDCAIEALKEHLSLVN